jgi:hypothetical protein
MEAELRNRLGVAVYGVGKETVAEVVGRLLAEKGLKLSVVDTLTGGQLVRELAEAGYTDRILTDAQPATLSDAAVRYDLQLNPDQTDGTQLAATLAQKAAPDGGVGLALFGPYGNENRTCIAVHGPGDIRLDEVGRTFDDNDYVRRWLVIQGLDRIRRAVLGQLTSPVDWK